MKSFTRAHFLLALAYAAASGAGCSSSDTTSNGAGGPAPKPDLDFTAFDQAVNAFLTQNGIKGASGVVVHKDWGVVHTAGYGAFDAQRIYLIASSSKVMSVGVLMHLADQGLVDFDKPISTYLSDWGQYKTDLTLAQLMSNSSGLVGLTDNPTYGPYLCQYISGGTLTDCAKTIYTANDTAARKPPDTEFHYGGGAWQLSGGIAEVASGKSWADLIQEIYAGPCDMPNTGYTNQYQKALTTGAGSVPDGGTAGADGGLSSVSAALQYPTFFDGDISTLPVTNNPSIEGGAYTTVGDYGNLLLMHLRGGTCGDNRVLAAADVARMQEDRIGMVYNGTTIDPTLAGYGLGWWVDRNHPGVVADAGAYGAMPWIDNPRNYGAFLVIQEGAAIGTQLRIAVKPVLDAVFDGTPAK